MSNKRIGGIKPGYKVGYGRPPVEHQFKPGQSGNPKGRPRKAVSFEGAFTAMLASKMPMTVNGKRQLKTMVEVAVLRSAKDIATGSPRALERWIPLINRYAPRSPSEDAEAIDLSSFTDEELRVLASIKLPGRR